METRTGAPLSYLLFYCLLPSLHQMGSASVKMLWVCCWVVFDPWQFPVNDKQLFGSQRSTNNRSGYLVCRVVATTHSQFERDQHYFRVAPVWRGKISTLFQSGSTMEGYSNSYQNGTSARETEFQRLAQNVGTNVQKILQNGIARFFNVPRLFNEKKLFSVSSMQRMISQIGTAQDNQQLQNQLHQIQHYTGQVFSFES